MKEKRKDLKEIITITKNNKLEMDKDKDPETDNNTDKKIIKLKVQKIKKNKLMYKYKKLLKMMDGML